MIKIVIFFLAITSICTHNANWAVLVAGSYGYENYRHQSDVFHAYHILINHGFNKDNIIVFAYDDIANNRRNPFPGKVFNAPNGQDVYNGVEIDYRGEDVTPQNFISVITGDKDAVSGIGSGRVLESTRDDNVFIYFSDHGADGLIAFPKAYLFANKLNTAIKQMHEISMYNKLVFYLEACYSGSMFADLLQQDINVYATTAAGTHESSFSAYCGGQAIVNNTYIMSCLGDEYSVTWMQNSDTIDMDKTTLGEQIDFTKNRVLSSHCQEYGDTSMRDDLVGDFQSHKSSLMDYFLSFSKTLTKNPKAIAENNGRVKNEDMKLYYLKNLAEMTNDPLDIEEYQKEIFMAARSAKIFDLFKREFDLPDIRINNNIDFDCLAQTIQWYTDLCGMDIDRDQKYITYMTSFCTLKQSSWKAYHAFNEICKGL